MPTPFGKQPRNRLPKNENEAIINETIRRIHLRLPGLLAEVLPGIIAAGGGGTIMTTDDGTVMVDDDGHVMYVG